MLKRKQIKKQLSDIRNEHIIIGAVMTKPVRVSTLGEKDGKFRIFHYQYINDQYTWTGMNEFSNAPSRQLSIEKQNLTIVDNKFVI